MSNFISINNEIVKTIKQKQQQLNKNMENLNSIIDIYTENFNDLPIQNMEKAEDIVRWLKEVSVGTKLLQNYFDNFPSVKFSNNEYISDKIEKIENDPISNEVFNIIIPLGILLQQTISLRNI